MTSSIKFCYTLIALVIFLAASAQHGVDVDLPSSLIEQIIPLIASIF